MLTVGANVFALHDINDTSGKIAKGTAGVIKEIDNSIRPTFYIVHFNGHNYTVRVTSADIYIQ